MEAAEAHHDPDFLIVGHLSLAISYFWLGEPIRAREHADQVLSLYAEERHGHLMDVFNHNVKTLTLVFALRAIWMLGFPEQAVRVSDECEKHARRRGHAFDLGFALTTGADVLNYIGEPDEVLKRVEEAERLGRENRLPFLTGYLVPVRRGTTLIRHGQVSEGIARSRRASPFSRQPVEG